MSAATVAVVSAALVGIIGIPSIEGAIRIVTRQRRRPITPNLRRRLYLFMLCPVLLVAGVSGWAFKSHHPGVAVAALIAAWILPPGLLRLPMRMGRRRAAGAKSKRSPASQSREDR